MASQMSLLNDNPLAASLEGWKVQTESLTEVLLEVLLRLVIDRRIWVGCGQSRGATLVETVRVAATAYLLCRLAGVVSLAFSNGA